MSRTVPVPCSPLNLLLCGIRRKSIVKEQKGFVFRTLHKKIDGELQNSALVTFSICCRLVTAVGIPATTRFGEHLEAFLGGGTGRAMNTVCLAGDTKLRTVNLVVCKNGDRYRP